MAARATTELSAEQCHEVATWIEANRDGLPDSVRSFLELHRRYLAAGEGDPLRRALEAAWRELRRALHLTPSSEKRRSSGSPLAGLPGAERLHAKGERERLEARIARGCQLSGWHRGLKKRHDKQVERLKTRLAKMSKKADDEDAWQESEEENQPLEEIELTEEERAESEVAAERFIEHLLEGGGADPAMQSVTETLMPGGTVLVEEEHAQVPALVPEGLAGARVVKTLHEERVRYDFAVTLRRIELDVEKKILVDGDGGRHVVTGSTSEYGPARFSVTWGALATLAMLIGQYALPFNRLGTLLSSQVKRFTAGALGRMLHYVAQRFVPIYLELSTQLSNSDYLAGDDTSCRVLEVSSWFEKVRAEPAVARSERPPPWSGYATPSAAEESLWRCEEAQKARVRRREDGDREAVRTREEMPSLGVLIGTRLPFESLRKNGDGPKEAMHTTVVTGRSAADDPKSLIVFYRSHLGSCGNLFESVLESREAKRTDLVLQGDLSTSNLVTSEDLLARLNIRFIGCSTHARRPFALYEDEDPVLCGAMLHLFVGLAIHEQQLDEFGRNPKNVLAVRGTESRELWNDIRELASTMAERWSKATNLGAGARYIINHFEELTAYLDDPRLEPSNTLRERMLRTEKLIEGSSMFRKTLEGRFALDVVRTILQTAVAAGVPVHEYLVSVLRTSEDEIAKHPEGHTPRAWAAANVTATASSAPSAPSAPPAT
jgi:hypothetical protein